MNIRANENGFSIEAFGEEWFRCPAFVGVDAGRARDADERFIPMKAYRHEETAGGTVDTWTTCSNLWRRKDYVLESDGRSARFYVRVEGEGQVDSLRFFGGKAAYEAAGYVLPVANHSDYTRNIRMSNEPSVIELGYFTPPCYVYPFYMPDCGGWLGVGLAAREGQYNFHQFLYANKNDNACGFEVPLYGQTEVRGAWESQSLVFVEGSDAYDVVRAYADWHYDNGWCRRHDRAAMPDWWRRPIFCGWGEQEACRQKYGLGQTGDYARQQDYEDMMRRLDAYQLDPGVIIIDAKWQAAYGAALPDPEKWPDLRGFVDREHAKGRHVLLWFRSWHPEGLGADECVEYLCTACAADPTSPAYRSRMKETMRRLLSDEPGCFNCDGFKIDYANCMPLGRYVRCHEKGVWGVELLKRFFTMMYGLAKAVKPDALINCSCAHPYFDEVTDQCRMHDYYGAMRNAPELFGHRARLAAAALPGVPIDMDSGGVGSRRDFHRWIRAQGQLGVPDLYMLTAQQAVPFDEEDIGLIRRCWQDYEAKIAREKP